MRRWTAGHPLASAAGLAVLSDRPRLLQCLMQLRRGPWATQQSTGHRGMSSVGRSNKLGCVTAGRAGSVDLPIHAWKRRRILQSDMGRAAESGLGVAMLQGCKREKHGGSSGDGGLAATAQGRQEDRSTTTAHLGARAEQRRAGELPGSDPAAAHAADALQGLQVASNLEANGHASSPSLPPASSSSTPAPLAFPSLAASAAHIYQKASSPANHRLAPALRMGALLDTLGAATDVEAGAAAVPGAAGTPRAGQSHSPLDPAFVSRILARKPGASSAQPHSTEPRVSISLDALSDEAVVAFFKATFSDAELELLLPVSPPALDDTTEIAFLKALYVLIHHADVAPKSAPSVLQRAQGLLEAAIQHCSARLQPSDSQTDAQHPGVAASPEARFACEQTIRECHFLLAALQFSLGRYIGAYQHLHELFGRAQPVSAPGTQSTQSSSGILYEGKSALLFATFLYERDQGKTMLFDRLIQISSADASTLAWAETLARTTDTPFAKYLLALARRFQLVPKSSSPPTAPAALETSAELLLEAAMSRGFLPATFHAGLLCFANAPRIPGLQPAWKQLFKDAARRGYPPAVAHWYLRERAEKALTPQTCALLKTTAVEGDPYCLYLLGLALSRVNQYQSSVVLLTTAARKDFGPAMHWLARIALAGFTTPRLSSHDVLSLMLVSATRGDAFTRLAALERVGQLHLYGLHDTPRSVVTGRHFLHHAIAFTTALVLRFRPLLRRDSAGLGGAGGSAALRFDQTAPENAHLEQVLRSFPAHALSKGDADRLASVLVRRGMACLSLDMHDDARVCFAYASQFSPTHSLHLWAAEYLGVGGPRKTGILELLVKPPRREQQNRFEFMRLSRLLAAVFLHYFGDAKDNPVHRKWVLQLVTHVVQGHATSDRDKDDAVSKLFGFAPSTASRSEMPNKLDVLLAPDRSRVQLHGLTPEHLSTLCVSVTDHEFWDDMTIMFHHAAITHGFAKRPWLDSPLFANRAQQQQQQQQR